MSLQLLILFLIRSTSDSLISSKFCGAFDEPDDSEEWEVSPEPVMKDIAEPTIIATNSQAISIIECRVA